MKKFLSVLLSVIFIMQISVCKIPENNVRTIDADEIRYNQDLMAYFEDADIECDEDIVYFSGNRECDSSYGSVFDNLAEEDMADYNVKYNCEFDANKMQYHIVMTLMDSELNEVDYEEIYSDAFVTEYGGLDTIFEIDGEIYQLSDYEEDDIIDECGFFLVAAIIAAVVLVYHITTETAEQVRGKSNYTYNKNLEKNGNGVKKGNIIFDQNEKEWNYHNAGNYRFGFTTFDNVGCEVAAVYNARIKMGKQEMLSDTIYKFEKWAIEYSCGWGKLGSDPNVIYRYFDKEGIKYTRYMSYSSFEYALSQKKSCIAIMSRWSNNVKDGIHTFCIDKKSQYVFDVFNYNEEHTRDEYTVNSINNLWYKKGFVVGYIVG